MSQFSIIFFTIGYFFFLLLMYDNCVRKVFANFDENFESEEMI